MPRKVIESKLTYPLLAFKNHFSPEVKVKKDSDLVIFYLSMFICHVVSNAQPSKVFQDQRD